MSIDLSKALDRCIYCRLSGVPLTLEHVIPQGLGGTLKLERATCYDCMKQIQSFEPFCITKTFEVSRTFFKVKSKKKHKFKGRNLPVGIGEAADKKWVQADFDTYPFAMGVPVFPPATLLQGIVKETSEIVISHLRTWFSAEYLARIKKFAGQGKASTFTLFETERFSRFMAKIAHGFAVSELGLDGFTPIATNFIRAIPDPLSFSLVGEAIEPISKAQPNLHEMDIQYVRDLVTVRVQLFAPITGAPTYQVVVGKRLPELPAPDQGA